MYKICIAICIVCLIFLSCSEEIEIDIPANEAKLTVYCTLVPFTIPPKNLRLDIQSSVHIFDTTKNVKITDATVLLYSNSNSPDTIQYNNDLQNYFANFSPKTGDSLHVEVLKEGYKSVLAYTIIPNKVDIIDTKVTPIAYFDETGSVFSEIEINFKDPANEINYYEIAVSNIDFNYDNPDDYYNLSTTNNIITSESYYPSLIRFYLDMPKSLLFNDKTINGKDHTITVYYNPPQEESEYRWISDHYVNIHLRNVTEEYYKFHTSMIQHLYNKEEDILYGLGEPLNVFTNIENGYGVFAGFNNDVRSIHINKIILNN